MAAFDSFGNVLRTYPSETQIESRIADLILRAES
jgi:hypothetical protein